MELTVAGHRCRLGTGGRPFDPANSRWPPLLLIHGAANDRDAWLQVAGALATAGCAVLVPDLPGHGLSSGPPLRSIELSPTGCRGCSMPPLSNRPFWSGTRWAR